MRIQTTHCEEIFAKDTSDRALLSKINREFLKFNNKKTTWLKNGPKVLRATSLNKIYTWQISMWKDTPNIWHKETQIKATMKYLLWNEIQHTSYVLSCIQLLATPWTVAHQAPLSMEFSRRKYRSRLPFPPPGDLPDPGIKSSSLMSPSLAGGFFTISATWEALLRMAKIITIFLNSIYMH